MHLAGAARAFGVMANTVEAALRERIAAEGTIGPLIEVL